MLAWARGPRGPVQSYQESGHPSTGSPYYTFHHPRGASLEGAEVKEATAFRLGHASSLLWQLLHGIDSRPGHSLLVKSLSVQLVKLKIFFFKQRVSLCNKMYFPPCIHLLPPTGHARGKNQSGRHRVGTNLVSVTQHTEKTKTKRQKWCLYSNKGKQAVNKQINR